MDSPITDASGFSQVKIDGSEKISELEQKIAQIQGDLNKYIEEGVDKSKVIDEQNLKIQLLEDRVRKISSELLEKDQKLLNLSALPEKVRALETEKHFLKKRIEMLVSATNSRVTPNPTTPKSDSKEYLSETNNATTARIKCSTPGASTPSRFTTWSEKVTNQDSYRPLITNSEVANRILKLSSQVSSKEKITAKEKEISELINSLSSVKKERSRTEKITAYNSLEHVNDRVLRF